MLEHWPLLATISIVVILAVLYRRVPSHCGVIIVPDDGIGLVTKQFVLFGKYRRLPDGRIVALNGEAGYQADTLAPGLHVGLWPWQYTAELVPYFTVPPGKVGRVEACDSFQDARAFLTNDGERGPQMAVIAPGTYRMNPFLFSVMLGDAVDVEDYKVGIVTTRAGNALAAGENAGPVIEGHNMFQSPQAFVDGRGSTGLQVQVLLAGCYFISPRFATIETVDMTEVPIAHLGVEIAYVGRKATT